MSVSLQEQISTLFSCLAMGLGVGLLYDLLRLVRLTLPRRTLQEILDLLFWLGGLRDALFLRDRLRQRPGAGCTWPCACCWGQRLIFFCSAPGPGGRWTSWPGPPPVSGLGDSAPPVAYSCSHGSVGKNFKKVEKNLEKVLFFFPVVEYNMSSNRETWQICRP